MKSFIAEKNDAGQRLDKYLSKLLREAPKSFLYKMLRKKNITLNGRRAAGSEILAVGDEIRLYLADETFAKFRGSEAVQSKGSSAVHTADRKHSQNTDFEANILYEDGDLLFWNKPQGILAQPDHSGEANVSEMLTDYLLASGKYTPADLKTFHPAPANRLDRNTSGIVLCGISLSGLQFLSEMMRDRRTEKKYVCIISGKLKDGVYSAWLYKDPKRNRVSVSGKETPGSKRIITAFTTRDTYGDYSVLEAELITGRPHQIRAHLSFLGCSILGDPKYGDIPVNREVRKKYGIQYQMLHAESITFPEIEGHYGYLSEKKFYAGFPDSFLPFCSVHKLNSYKNDREGLVFGE